MSVETVKIKEGKRWSGAEWGEMQQEIMIVGNGGIGSWLSLCLARNDHSLWLIDGDMVDTTNVQGGQMFKTKDVGIYKSDAVQQTCREFGCVKGLNSLCSNFNESMGVLPCILTGLDNMKARKLVFKEWKKSLDGGEEKEKYILIDGRLNLEDYEILCVRGDRPEDIERYEREYLFDDEEVPDADCTTKQSTYTAMGIASWMTAILCNWLANKKLGFEFRDTPFHTRVYYPAMMVNISETKLQEVEV